VEETSADEAVAMMAMPYFAAFYLTRALLPAMLDRGTGQIIYVNSPAALVAWPGATGYTAARWALRGLAEALRADLLSPMPCPLNRPSGNRTPRAGHPEPSEAPAPSGNSCAAADDQAQPAGLPSAG